MAGKYDSFYRDDIERMIRETALECMMDPLMDGKKIDGTGMTIVEIQHRNSLIAMNNAGVKDLADRLIERLNEPEKSDG